MYGLLLTISIIQGLAILLIVGFCTWGAYHFLYDLCERKLNLKTPQEKLQDIPLKVATLVSRVIAIALPIILFCAWGFAYLSYWKLNRLGVSSTDIVSISIYGYCEIAATILLTVCAVTQIISAKSIARGKIKYRNLLMISWSIILLTVFNLNSYFGNVIVHFFLDGAALFCFWVLALRPYDATLINKNCKNFSYPVKLALLVIFIGIITFPNLNMGQDIVDVTKVRKSETPKVVEIKNEPLYVMFNYENKELDKLAAKLARKLVLDYKLPCERGIDREYLSTLPENSKVLVLEIRERNHRNMQGMKATVNAFLDNYNLEQLVSCKLLQTSQSGNHRESTLSKLYLQGKKHQLNRLFPEIAAEELATIIR